MKLKLFLFAPKICSTFELSVIYYKGRSHFTARKYMVNKGCAYEHPGAFNPANSLITGKMTNKANRWLFVLIGGSEKKKRKNKLFKYLYNKR